MPPAQRCGTPEYAKENSLITSVLTSSPANVDDSGMHGIHYPDEVIVVPVVFHILYNTNSQNVSDQQVLSQLASFK